MSLLERVKASNQSEWRGGRHKQAAKSWKSDKDGIDSRTTGRVESGEEENDIRDKEE